MHRPWPKRILHALGGIVAVAGVAFVTARLWQSAGSAGAWALDAGAWGALLGLAMVYGLAGLMLARAWSGWTRVLGVGLSWPTAWRLYGVSQMAKYVPGNVFQFAGRQALGMAAGVPGWQLARSAVWEVVGLVLAGAVFAAWLLPLYWPGLSPSFAALTFAGSVVVVAAGLRAGFGKAAAASWIWQVGFHAVAALVFVGVLWASGGAVHPASLGPVCGAYVLAWLAGLVTPGAPAGIGVRELLLLLLLEPIVPDSPLPQAIVLARAVNAGGDLLFYLLAALPSRPRRDPLGLPPT